MTTAEAKKSNKKVLTGSVVSDKMDKTIVVRVERSFRHPLYKKVVKTSKKYYAHDEKNEVKAGDVVRIIEARRLSHLKRWQLVEIVQQGKKQ